MRVALDVTLLSIPQAEQSGMARYARELALRLPDAAPGLDLCAFSRRPLSAPDALRARALPRLRGRWLAAAERLPVELICGPVSVAHAPAGVPARTLRAARVYTVHDLQVIASPEDFEPWVREIMTSQLREAARTSDAVICISEATLRQAVEFLGLDPGRLTVVPNGVSAPSSGRAPLPRGLRAGGYLLHVGTLERRKNLVLLLEAYSRLRRRMGGSSPELVLAGNHGHQVEPVLEARVRLGLEESVHLLGHVSEAQLESLYENARALVYPSLHEGFGLPALEAMVRGCPVMCSDAGALPEVVGDAALVVPARDEPAWAGAMERIAQDDALCSHLVAAGRTRGALFSWERTARETAAVYAKVAA